MEVIYEIIFFLGGPIGTVLLWELAFYGRIRDSRIREDISTIERKWKERRRLLELGATSSPNQESWISIYGSRSVARCATASNKHRNRIRSDSKFSFRNGTGLKLLLLSFRYFTKRTILYWSLLWLISRRRNERTTGINKFEIKFAKSQGQESFLRPRFIKFAASSMVLWCWFTVWIDNI